MTGAECLLQQRPDKAEFHFPRTRYRDTVKAKRMLLRRAIHKISTEFVDLQPDAFQFSPIHCAVVCCSLHSPKYVLRKNFLYTLLRENSISCHSTFKFSRKLKCIVILTTLINRRQFNMVLQPNNWFGLVL